jgi:hypothetical protein
VVVVLHSVASTPKLPVVPGQGLNKKTFEFPRHVFK